MVKRLCILLLFVSILAIGFSQRASALSGTEFQSGRIMDDGVFFNGNALDAPTIQSFLNSKVPSCDTNGTSPYNGTTRATYGTSKGYPPPYTCLKDYTQDTPTKPAESGLCGQYSGGTRTAAQIIRDVGVACGVNQKVLIVLLEKEQSLVTDDWPWSVQYRSATGYGCPDTAPCDTEYYGFFNQVYNAARQFKRYSHDASLFRYRAYRDNYIQYNPNTSCGGSYIYIQNQATAGLYNYTPYQPNQAALSNLYGAGDSCSAYGNRNFWRLYTDWFGSTIGVKFSASFRGVSPATSAHIAYKGTLWFDFQNTGSDFWKDDMSALPYYPRTRLAGSWPINRSSAFADSSWASPNRPVSVFTKVFENDGVTLAADQHTVWPGQVARFGFAINYPNDINPGTYKEHFELVQDGAKEWWVPGGYAWQEVTINPKFQAHFKAVSPEATVKPGQNDKLWYEFYNYGSSFWKDDMSALPYYPRTRLAGSWPINRSSAFADSSWLNSSRPVSVFKKVYESNGITLASDQHTVWPGQVARFEFDVKYPPGGVANGSYKEHFELVQDGAKEWWVPGGYAWQMVNASNQ